MTSDVDPGRFPIETASPRGFAQAYVRQGSGGVPLVCIHGWPESKRLFWKVIEPLADAGFEVIVPDLRGFGDSELGPDGFNDVPTHARDIYALVHDVLGHESVVLVAGDLGGVIIQDLALRYPGWVDRMVLFNSPLPYLKAEMASIAGTRPAREAADYFIRQGTDPDGLAADLTTPEQRRRYIATFYASRFWGHPGGFDAAAVDFHTEPFADAAKLRASFGGYESSFSPSAQSEPSILARNPDTRTLIMHGTSDHVIYPSFDRMAAQVFPNHVGPFLLRDCGHFVPWEAPHQLTSGTIAFCGDLLSFRRVA